MTTAATSDKCSDTNHPDNQSETNKVKLRTLKHCYWANMIFRLGYIVYLIVTVQLLRSFAMQFR